MVGIDNLSNDSSKNTEKSLFYHNNLINDNNIKNWMEYIFNFQIIITMNTDKLQLCFLLNIWFLIRRKTPIAHLF